MFRSHIPNWENEQRAETKGKLAKPKTCLVLSVALNWNVELQVLCSFCVCACMCLHVHVWVLVQVSACAHEGQKSTSGVASSETAQLVSLCDLGLSMLIDQKALGIHLSLPLSTRMTCTLPYSVLNASARIERFWLLHLHSKLFTD